MTRATGPACQPWKEAKWPAELGERCNTASAVRTMHDLNLLTCTDNSCSMLLVTRGSRFPKNTTSVGCCLALAIMQNVAMAAQGLNTAGRQQLTIAWIKHASAWQVYDTRRNVGRRGKLCEELREALQLATCPPGFGLQDPALRQNPVMAPCAHFSLHTFERPFLTPAPKLINHVGRPRGMCLHGEACRAS